MPNSMHRVFSALSALIAASFIAIAGAGFAVADPEDSRGEPGTTKPTTKPPSIFDIPQTIATQLRDRMGRPRSAVGNGRTAGVRAGSATPGQGEPSGHRHDRQMAIDAKPATPSEPIAPALADEPVVDAGAASGSGDGPPGDGPPDLPVLQAPPAMPRAMPSAGPRAAVPPDGVGPAEQVPSTGAAAPRAGYSQYLRSARIGEVAIVALPGLAGLLAITAGGGVLGYRQANSCRYVRSDATRFLQ